MGDRARVEERRHQRQLVILAAEIQRLVGLPGMPQRPDRLDLFAQLAHYGFRPGHAETALDMGFDLGAQPQDKTALGSLGQVPGQVSQVSRAAGESDCHCRAKRQFLSVFSDQDPRQERVMLGFRSPYRLKAN
jgi:hypothetical protein